MGLISNDLYVYHGTRTAYDRVLLPGDPGFASETGQASGAAFYTFATTDPNEIEIIRDNARVYGQDGMVLSGRLPAGSFQAVDSSAPIGEELAARFREHLSIAQTGDPHMDAYFRHLGATLNPEINGAALWGSIAGDAAIKSWIVDSTVSRLGDVQATLNQDKKRLNAAIVGHPGLEDGFSAVDSFNAEQRTVIASNLRALHPETSEYHGYYEQLADRVEQGKVSPGKLFEEFRTPSKATAYTRQHALDHVELPPTEHFDAHWGKLIGDMGVAGIYYRNSGAGVMLFQGDVGVRQLPALSVEELHGNPPKDLRTNQSSPIEVGTTILEQGGGRMVESLAPAAVDAPTPPSNEIPQLSEDAQMHSPPAAPDTGPRASLSVVGGAEATPVDIQRGTATVERLHPTSQIKPFADEFVSELRNASVDRVVSRAPTTVLPVAANDGTTTPFRPDTSSRTTAFAPANDVRNHTVTQAPAPVNVTEVAHVPVPPTPTTSVPAPPTPPPPASPSVPVEVVVGAAAVGVALAGDEGHAPSRVGLPETHVAVNSGGRIGAVLGAAVAIHGLADSIAAGREANGKPADDLITAAQLTSLGAAGAGVVEAGASTALTSMANASQILRTTQSVAGRAGIIGAVGAGALITAHGIATGNAEEVIAGTAGTGGALAGAILGAEAGTVFGPVGSVAGAVVGGIAFSEAGKATGQGAYAAYQNIANSDAAKALVAQANATGNYLASTQLGKEAIALAQVHAESAQYVGGKISDAASYVAQTEAGREVIREAKALGDEIAKEASEAGSAIASTASAVARSRAGRVVGDAAVATVEVVSGAAKVVADSAVGRAVGKAASPVIDAVADAATRTKDSLLGNDSYVKAAVASHRDIPQDWLKAHFKNGIASQDARNYLIAHGHPAEKVNGLYAQDLGNEFANALSKQHNVEVQRAAHPAAPLKDQNAQIAALIAEANEKGWGKRLDGNGDGKYDVDDIAINLKKTGMTLDADGKNGITGGEFIRAQTTPAKPAQVAATGRSQG